MPYDHDHLGAECPTCSPFTVGRIAYEPPAQRQAREAQDVLLQRLKLQYPKGIARALFKEQPLYEPPAITLARHERLKRFRDSRGLLVEQWPTHLLPSATIIIAHHIPLSHATPMDIVVHQRSDNGWWGLPGGRMELGESILDCARREAYEETGLEVHIERLVSVDSDPTQYAICQYPDGNAVHYCNLTFLATVTGGVFRPSDESLQLRWVNVKELPQPFLPAHMWRLEQALRQRDGVEVR